MPAADGDRRAGARPAGAGLAGAALVHTQPDMAPIHDLHESDVGAVRKPGVILDRRPEARNRRIFHGGDLQHGVRIADRDCADLHFARADAEGIDISFAARLERQRSRLEIGHAHRHGHLLVAKTRLDETAGAVEHELGDALGRALAQEAGDAASAVAALLDFTAVGIEDPVVGGGSLTPRRLEHERLVEADAGVAIREAPNRRCIGSAAGRGVEQDEVVAEPVHLRELHARILPVKYFVASKAPRVGFVSLGCPKALVDSERILTQLRAEGYDVAPSYASADLVVVNTCGFIDEAVHESLDAIGEAIAKNGRVIVTGCLGAKPHKILERHPAVLRVTGPHAYEDVVGAVHEHLPPRHDPFVDLVPPQGVRLTPRHYAYLKISEGCNHRCSFCIIPSMRGRLASRPIGKVLNEAVRLRNASVRELLVISQDTSAYGADLKYRAEDWGSRRIQSRFIDLARELGEIGPWVRLHYVYPYPHVDEVIPLMAEGKVLPYLDVPFQHGSPRVLKLMRRPAHAENTLARIRRWRAQVPHMTIRSTFIVGFPGETEEDFRSLLDWLEEAELDRVGCFKYSPVEGATANGLPDPVPEEVKEERWHRFMQAQQRISARRLAARIGRRMRVLVDAIEEEAAVARSEADAPEIDGVVRIRGQGASRLPVGEFVDVEVTGASEYDLEARVA
jgi:ribosomal protein S12 methylthiotransferase